jgi:hypothetical protein
LRDAFAPPPAKTQNQKSAEIAMIPSTLAYAVLASGGALCLLALNTADHACSTMDLSGRWVLRQSTGHTLSVNLRQDGAKVTGTAIRRPDGKRGEVRGSVDAAGLQLRVAWASQGMQLYTSSVSPSRELSGRTWDFDKPTVRADWSSSVRLRCSRANRPDTRS